MMKNSELVLLLCVLLGLVLIFVGASCTLSCPGDNKTEGFVRTPLKNACGFVRSPVDYAYSEGVTAKDNPHYIADPSNSLQPLEQGPIDFHRDNRALAQGSLFSQYENDYRGATTTSIPVFDNDAKTRATLTRVGDVEASRNLNQIPTFRNVLFEEIPMSENSVYEQMYGGNMFHILSQNPGD